MVADVCAKVSLLREAAEEEVRLLGRSRRAGTNQRSVANSRGDAVAHVPPERSEANGGVLCWGRGGCKVGTDRVTQWQGGLLPSQQLPAREQLSTKRGGY